MRALVLCLLAACTGHVLVLDAQPAGDDWSVVVTVPSYDCNLDHIACDVPAPVCKDGEVPTVQGACYGPCVSPSLCESL